MRKYFEQIANSGIILASLIGIFGFFICEKIDYAAANPLLVSLCLGILTRAILKRNILSDNEFNLAVRFFIPVGIFFYGLSNLNFVTVTKLDIKNICLLIIVLSAYFLSVLITGKILRQKKSITYLTSSGSAICGASAITITSSAIKADSRDISVSILSVAMAGLFATFILVPFCGSFFNMYNDVYAVFAGSVLQFTGFVKSAAADVPFLRKQIQDDTMISLALAVKTTRYFALIISIPVFASLTKRKIVIPATIIIFLCAGFAGTLLSIYSGGYYNSHILEIVKNVYYILWSIAMASVGLDTDIREFLSDAGTKGIIMAFSGSISACGAFIAGYYLLNLFF